jgi:hypothetical protein
MRDSLVKIMLLHRRCVANKKKSLTKEEGNSKHKYLRYLCPHLLQFKGFLNQ